MRIGVFVALFATAGCGGYSSPSNNPGSGTLPSLSQLVPGSVTAGSAAFTLTVNGSGFGSDAVVRVREIGAGTGADCVIEV